MDVDVAASKQRLRTRMRERRAALSPDERARRSGRAVDTLLGLPELRAAQRVLLYAATGTEADPGGAVEELRARGATVLLPRVEGDDLAVVALPSGATPTPGYRRIPEPAGPARAPTEVDVAVTPGLAFDRAGGRLGQGGGHYDRLLGRLREDATVVGFAFAVQVVARVPRATHDRTVGLVVTEDGVLRTLGSASEP